ncbi:MAG: hypothetical protein PHT02_01125 [Tissierellia bacterium]|nr:hypothetical protein [Tissierellia bacterium]
MKKEDLFNRIKGLQTNEGFDLQANEKHDYVGIGIRKYELIDFEVITFGGYGGHYITERVSGFSKEQEDEIINNIINGIEQYFSDYESGTLEDYTETIVDVW